MVAFSQSQSTCLWKSHLFHCEPLWPHEPKISAIASLLRQHLNISDTADIKIDFFSQGAFNKLSISLLANQFGGKIVDVSENTVIVELAGKSSRVDAFFNLLKPFGVLESARSGESIGAVSRPN